MSSALHATLGHGINLYYNKEKKMIDSSQFTSSFILDYINSMANQSKSRIKRLPQLLCSL